MEYIKWSDKFKVTCEERQQATGNRQQRIKWDGMGLINNSNHSQLIILIGLPGSGKSTLSQQLIQSYPHSKLISTDAIRAHLFGDANIQGNWLLIWQEIERQLQRVLENSIEIAVYDATNVVRKQRKQVIQLARHLGFQEIIGIWLVTPIQLCLSRNQNRDRTIPPEVILEMSVHLYDAPPALEDGLDQLIYCYSEENPLLCIGENRTK